MSESVEQTNLFICETSLHVAEATSIVEQDFEDSRNILIVTNSPRVSDMDTESLGRVYDRHFIANYKLNISNKEIPFVPESVKMGLNKALTYISLLLMVLALACMSLLVQDLNIFFSTQSPILNNGLAWIRNHGWAQLYHFEVGIGLYMQGGLKDRGRLSEVLFPLTLESLLSDGIIDGVYCMRPDDLSTVYPNVVTKEINFYAHNELLTALFESDFHIDRLSNRYPLFVLVTQPLVENDYISAQAYREKTEAIITALGKTHHVIVKPHPGEDTMRYVDMDVTVLHEADYPVELLIWSLLGRDDVPEISVGSTGLSTALSNLAAVPVKKHSFIEYYELDEMDKKMRQYYSNCSIEYVSEPKALFGVHERSDSESESNA
ncbi:MULTISPECIES: alpha-2,8-polysialyltransferase family protein [Haloarcula]|nr:MULTISPECIES: alpha-2,8-polysialyltransferase family protein [Haloarcula]